MRLLRFDFRDDFNSVDLHPLITVVSGLQPVHQRQLFEAVRRLSTGSTVGLRGLVEHQGLLVELDAGTGDPLGSVNTSATVLVYIDGVAIQCGEVGLQAEIDQWERQAAIDSVAVEEIRSNLDLAVKARALGLRLLTDPGCEAETSAATSPRRLMIATIRRAFEEANAHEAEIAQCDPTITLLLERWDTYRSLRDDAEEHLFQIAAGVAKAETAVLDRSHDLDISVAAAKPVLLTVDQEARLEALCDASNAADGSSRLGKWKKPGSKDEAERQALLDLIGVKSWTEYSVFRMSPTVSAERREVVAEAEGALARAKQDLDQARSLQATDAVAARLNQDLERIKADSQPYLGVLVPSDVGAALREHIARVENPDWLSALNHLRDALSSNELHPPYGLEPNELLGWTDSWLRAQESLDSADQADSSAPADGVDGCEPDGQNGQDQKVDRDEEQSPLVIAERLATTNHILARHNRALAQIDKAERAAVRSAMRVRELKQQLRARSTGPEVTTAAAVLAMIAPVAEQILRDVGGSLPIAVVGEMGGLADGEVETMMGAMEEVAQQVQVLLITDHRGVIDWVERVGMHRAALASETRAPI